MRFSLPDDGILKTTVHSPWSAQTALPGGSNSSRGGKLTASHPLLVVKKRDRQTGAGKEIKQKCRHAAKSRLTRTLSAQRMRDDV